MNTPADNAQNDDAARGWRIWQDYENRQAFEHTLIDRKTTWMLTTESILFAAFGLSFQSNHNVTAFRVAISSSAALFALTSWFGVLRLIASKKESWEIYGSFFERHDEVPLPGPLSEKPLQWGVETMNTRLSLWPDKLFPWIFIMAWTFLLIWSVTQ
jgi:hypothetical protein